MYAVYAYFMDRPGRLIGVLLLSLVFVVMAIEWAYSAWSRRGLYEGKDTGVNLKMYLGYFVVHFLALPGLTAMFYEEISRFALFDIGRLWWLFLGNVSWWHWVLLLVLDDFIFYWYHRWCHTYRVFGASHVGHHSSHKFNISVGLRQPWTPLLPILVWIPLVLIGFEPTMVLIMSGLNLIFQIFLHTQVIKSFGPLDYVLNSPAHHRVHHACNPQYVDKNFGGVFIIWDRLFGTFAAEREAPVFGIASGRPHYRIWDNSFAEWKGLCSDLRRAETWRGVVRSLFGPPKWD